jgi:hypothetical protein
MTNTNNVKIENVEVYGFRHALRNMRNPMESWDKSDSDFMDMLFGSEIIPDLPPEVEFYELLAGMFKQFEDRTRLKTNLKFIGAVPELPSIGPKDLELLLKLVKNGDEHAKVLRTITVLFDMTAPRYILLEVDTYKVGTVRNSCSTMHKLGKRDLTPEDFAATDDSEEYEYLLDTITYMNALGRIHRETKDYRIVKRLKRILPEGFLQRSGFCTNYAVLLRMFFQRKNHRLDEWRLTDGPPSDSICNWIKSLPYMAQIIEAKEKK